MLLYPLLGGTVPGTFVVLYYHSVGKEDLESFERQMASLARRSKPVPAHFEETPSAGVLHTAVTFDDGFSETIENVLPILTQQSIPFSVFVPTGFLGKKPTWGIHASESSRETILKEERMRVLGANKLVSFGSHCVSHRRLPELSDADAENEIHRSKRDLERILNRNIDTLSFPHGAFTQFHINCAKRSGYGRVFSIEPVLGVPSSEDFVFGRFSTDPSDWPIEFSLKAFGAYRWLPLAFSLKSKFAGFARSLTGLTVSHSKKA